MTNITNGIATTSPAEKKGPIELAIDWMKENQIDQITLECAGGGDSGQAEEITLIRNDKIEFDEDLLLPSDICAGLESEAYQRADWDWVNNEGGTATLDVYADGRYKLSGGVLQQRVHPG